MKAEGSGLKSRGLIINFSSFLWLILIKKLQPKWSRPKWNDTKYNLAPQAKIFKLLLIETENFSLLSGGEGILRILITINWNEWLNYEYYYIINFHLMRPRYARHWILTWMRFWCRCLHDDEIDKTRISIFSKIT